ncbi:general secretion pathway protein GspC [Sorangium cellulosum]|uniref:General secretion pathway protein GspC n=2 Tax=Sorangium cellulosum TaxID=56 RepID=A0A2L0EK43_SORCE|nr:general secretion pathway protein GspC [Sorangium cellulosum]
MLLKRYLGVTLCLMIALAAYFQASGVGHLVASSVAALPSPLPPAHHVRPAAVRTAQDHVTSAALILSRNPFDSVTGPLDGDPAGLVMAEAPPESRDPYEDPACDDIRALLIAQADDAAWSFAAMAGSDGRTVLRRQGDEAFGKTIHHVGWDRVWLTAGGARCQAVMGRKPARGGAPGASPAPEPAPSGPARRPATSTVPPEIAAKIRKISDTEFRVERSAIAAILEQQSELMRSVRIAPEPGGIKLARIRSGSLLETLGLKTGDKLASINGFEVSDVSKALEAYARLTTANHVALTISRDGKPMTIDFHID